MLLPYWQHRVSSRQRWISCWQMGTLEPHATALSANSRTIVSVLLLHRSLRLLRSDLISRRSLPPSRRHVDRRFDQLPRRRHRRRHLRLRRQNNAYLFSEIVVAMDVVGVWLALDFFGSNAGGFFKFLKLSPSLIHQDGSKTSFVRQSTWNFQYHDYGKHWRESINYNRISTPPPLFTSVYFVCTRYSTIYHMIDVEIREWKGTSKSNMIWVMSYESWVTTYDLWKV